MAVVGDIAIVSFGTDTDSVSIVVLGEISGETITITDNGWFAAGGFRTGEGSVTFTIPLNTPIGTVITIPASSLGTIALAVAGDQILIYQGTAASPTFLFALDVADGNNTFAADATSANTSAVPAGLTFGTNALGFSLDNGSYSGPLTGTRAEILANIANAANWTLNDTTTPAVPGNFTVTTSNPGSLAIVDASVIEGNTGTTPISFTVNRTGGTTGAVSATWTATFGTADAADFQSGQSFTGTVNFAAGASTATIVLNVQGDVGVEANENFTVTLSAPTGGATITTATATGTINNDDVAATPGALSIVDASVTEGNTGTTPISFTVNRTGGTSGAVTATWTATLVTADAADFASGQPLTGTVSFADGASSATIVLNVQGDTAVEANENFTIALSAPTGGVTITTATATGTINNDDVAPTPGTLSISNAAVTEGNAGTTPIVFNITRAGGSSGAVSATWTANFQVGSGNADSGDFANGQAFTGTVNFADGQTSATITLNVQGDTVVEPNELFTVSLTNPTGGVTLGTTTGTGTINNDDAAPVTIFINEFHYDNSGTDANEAIEIAGTAGLSLTGYSIVFYNGGSTPAQAAAATVYGTLNLTGTIDDEGAGYGAVSFAFTGIQNGSPDGFALIGPGGSVIQFLSYEGVLTAATGTPAAGLTSTDVGVFEAGSGPATNSLQLIGIGADAPDFTWQAEAPASFGTLNSGQTIIPATGTGQISVADISVLEGNSGTANLIFTVRRAGGSGTAASVDYALAFGSADAADIVGGTLSSGTVNFAVGATTATITVAVQGDTVGETNETILLTLSNPIGNITIADGSAIGTITNDDAAARTISEIQGSGGTSPYANQLVSTTGIVTAVDTSGYYLEDPTGDGNAATSDGIFVFTSATVPAVAVGDSVSVSGTVTEFQSSAGTGLTVTEITAPVTTVLSSGNALPAAILIGTGGILPPTSDYPAAIAFYESLEGMRVTIDTPLVVSNTNSFGETYVVASGGAGATSISASGGITISPNDLNPERIQIDDDSGIFAGFTPNYTIGDRLSSVTGVFNYAFNNYELLVTAPVTVTTDRSFVRDTAQFAGDATHITIATYNLENYDPLDGKDALLASDILFNLRAPDIIAAQEIQDADGIGTGTNLSGTTTAQGLINAIIAAGGPTYAYVEVAPTTANSTGGEPNGNIRNGYFYRTDRVQYVANSATLIQDAAYNNSRRPLVADFVFNGLTIELVNMHSKSRSGSDPLFGVNQPPTDLGDADRTAQATVVRSYVNNALATNPALNIAVLGDFNGFYFENALQTLAAGGVLTNLNSLLPVEERYSYLFDGNLQQIDNILVTGGLVTGARYDAVHINAENPATTTRPTDHDPQVAALFLAPIYSGTPGDDIYTAPVNVGYTINGNDGNDTLTGNASADIIFGGSGNDTLNGAGGGDTLVSGLGGDALDGGTGTDTADYSDDQGAVFVNLTSGLGYANAAAGDTYTGIENVTGSSFGDTLIGDAGANLLYGVDGDDVLIGAAGADVLNGGSGSDTASYEDNQGYVFVNLTSGDAFGVAAGDTFISIENLTGGAYADVFIGDAGANILNGGDGNDILIGAMGADTLIGGNGIDTASYEDNQGAVFVDLLNNRGIGAAAQGDTYSSIENVTGTAYQDILLGDNGANRLDGAAGNDILIGGNGNDTLVGGAGADSFRYLGGETGLDRILDFTPGSDTIFLAAVNFARTGTLTFQSGAGAVATTANSTFLYDTTTGIVSYDADGNGSGAAVQLAQLDTGLALTLADFVFG